MKKKSGIQFNIQGIKCDQFAIFESNYKPKKPINFGAAFKFGFNPEEKVIISFLEATFEQDNKPFIKIEVSCFFTLEPNSWNSFIDSRKQTLIVPKDFMIHMGVITVGTLRGILFAKTESTTFSQFIVPTINVKEMITKDVELSLNDDE